MLIPVKCFTCGKVIGNKYEWYLKEVEKHKGGRKDEIHYLDDTKIDKTIEGETMDKLGLKDICCRRHIFTHVNIF
jgi:DNA-directed RNA polymerase I, II, and III subunit RPABC5